MPGVTLTQLSMSISTSQLSPSSLSLTPSLPRESALPARADDRGDFVSADLERLFAQCFAQRFRTHLRGGAPEPFYQAASAEHDNIEATIFYRADYFRSAMHEVAHWCVAGEARRQQDDYGYWYAPDGRTEAQQREFEQLEVLPQAWELTFCAAANHPFDVSVDNLNGGAANLRVFQHAVRDKARELLEQTAASHRGVQWGRALAQYYRGSEVVLPQWLDAVSGR
jgi:elongation factor P hydroxylase